MTDIAFSHLAIVVNDLQSALNFWRESLGLSQAGEIETVAAEEVDVAFMTLGDAHIELIEPSTADSGIARFLAKRGPGIHHLCLEVPDLDAKLEDLSARGYQLINETPRERGGRRYAFVHPRSSGGVLLELYERK